MGLVRVKWGGQEGRVGSMAGGMSQNSRGEDGE